MLKKKRKHGIQPGKRQRHPSKGAARMTAGYQASRAIRLYCSHVIHRPDMLKALITKMPTAIAPFYQPKVTLPE